MASNGFPVEDRDGPTTQELEPIPSPRPTSGAMAETACAARPSAASLSGSGAGPAPCRMPAAGALDRPPCTPEGDHADGERIGGWALAS